jgi:anaerobic ribonucleoside-triphosphate reductase
MNHSIPPTTDRTPAETLAEKLARIDEYFGTITCLECHMVWAEQFVPEFCTRCGTRVSSVRGEGIDWSVRLVEKGLVPGKIIVCNRCGERYPDFAKARRCLRCGNDLPPAPRPRWYCRLVERLRRTLRL